MLPEGYAVPLKLILISALQKVSMYELLLTEFKTSREPS